MIGTAIPVEDLAAVTRAITDKSAAESGPLPFVTATVLSIDNSSDVFPHCVVHVDGDPADRLATVPSATGPPDGGVGSRVVVRYVRPNGAWVIGPIHRSKNE